MSKVKVSVYWEVFIRNNRIVAKDPASGSEIVLNSDENVLSAYMGSCWQPALEGRIKIPDKVKKRMEKLQQEAGPIETNKIKLTQGGMSMSMCLFAGTPTLDCSETGMELNKGNALLLANWLLRYAT